MMPRARILLTSIVVLAPSLLGIGAAEPSSGRRADQAALKAFGTLVGPWKGAGFPQRGSTRGAWTETADWSWKLSPDSAALTMTVGKGKYIKAAELKPGSEPGTFVFKAALADGSSRTFTGKGGSPGKLVLTTEGPGTEGVQRITLTPLHETRFLLLLEGRDPSGRFDRLAEVGYTRQGVAFAVGESGPVCIVTEGRGTTSVSYKGKTYHVCCSGCKELFESDPEGILAEAKEREKAKKK